MRNSAYFSNKTLARALEALRSRLPDGWAVVRSVREPRGSEYRPDALLEVRGPDGSRSTVVVEAKDTITASQAVVLSRQLTQAVEDNNAAASLLVTRYLSELARERLNAADISYLDLTGNTRITLSRPALFIEARGADRDPSPQDRGPRSLKGNSAARITRALCDWKPPLGVRELALRADTSPGYTTRILKFLGAEDVVARDAKGVVTNVNWADLLRRWARDYEVAKTNRSVAYLEPRGIDALLAKLRNYKKRWALTGSAAVPAGAASASSRMVSCYLEEPERAARDLQLRSVESGANVILLEPFDSVIWERTRKERNLTCVAVSQCAVDLLTGAGREPSEADSLLVWMAKNEDAWRA